jgi:4-hydroxythreonine-4-phosphate dehydrogenase
VAETPAWTDSTAPAGPGVADCRAIDAEAVRPGNTGKACGLAAYRYVRAAVDSAVAGRIAAIATAPINKESLHLAGLPYPGHTEMLGSLTGAHRTCMMMASDEMIVSLVTTHLGYRNVPDSLTRDRIVDVIELTADGLSRLGRASPTITVCSLNPHGGEHGLFGSEERDIIGPAVAEARRRGIDARGPLPPDTAYLQDRRRATDAYVAMYHDQGLIPFKMLAFEHGVNITLGLPIVRTSVDHGTAFDIAWKGTASAASLAQAVMWAVRLCRPPLSA